MAYLTAKQVQERYQICSMSLHRWLKNDEMKFPRPMVINRRRLFDETDIVEWERKRAKHAA
ncbi:helix-turn-helix domain-containing protein [Rhizobium laguerreae]|uniref:helix-turn-helix domain-containing protein n=1 Tax=Rhizobium laguerreae TaxID=1076926 RepID=UPI001479739D|nr:helix-turn-helix domain-containing protein [Rhizobium laguerreae]NNH46218.1 helix-turn-helix domain-containing protein [Rhizobium laguerreae]